MIILIIVSGGTLFSVALLTFPEPGSFKKDGGFIFNDYVLVCVCVHI